MKSRYFLILPLCLLAVLLGSCTRNNGDIGHYFGEWRLEAMTADGEEVTLYDVPADPDNGFGPVQVYTFAFQDNVIRINTIFKYHEFESSVGSWVDCGDKLEFDFSHSDDLNDSYGYAAPSILHFSDTGTTLLDIDRHDGGKLVLSQTAS